MWICHVKDEGLYGAASVPLHATLVLTEVSTPQHKHARTHSLTHASKLAHATAPIIPRSAHFNRRSPAQHHHH